MLKGAAMSDQTPREPDYDLAREAYLIDQMDLSRKRLEGELSRRFFWFSGEKIRWLEERLKQAIYYQYMLRNGRLHITAYQLDQEITLWLIELRRRLLTWDNWRFFVSLILPVAVIVIEILAKLNFWPSPFADFGKAFGAIEIGALIVAFLLGYVCRLMVAAMIRRRRWGVLHGYVEDAVLALLPMAALAWLVKYNAMVDGQLCVAMVEHPLLLAFVLGYLIPMLISWLAMIEAWLFGPSRSKPRQNPSPPPKTEDSVGPEKPANSAPGLFQRILLPLRKLQGGKPTETAKPAESSVEAKPEAPLDPPIKSEIKDKL
jgi:hypothetical protein